MEEFDDWRLCDELTVAQAALLIAGYDPAQFPLVMYQDIFERPEKFTATLTALAHAILGGRIPAKLCYKPKWDQIENSLIKQDTGEPDWDNTTVLVEDLKIWLSSRGIETGFFFPHPSKTHASALPSYPDSTQSHYPKKLAAAIGAWQAVNADQTLLKGKTVKQAMINWLKENAEQFNLIKNDGTLNKKGVEEAATVANWDDKGGAPKTPT